MNPSNSPLPPISGGREKEIDPGWASKFVPLTRKRMSKEPEEKVPDDYDRVVRRRRREERLRRTRNSVLLERLPGELYTGGEAVDDAFEIGLGAGSTLNKMIMLKDGKDQDQHSMEEAVKLHKVWPTDMAVGNRKISHNGP